MKTTSPMSRLIAVALIAVAFSLLVFVPGQRKLKTARAETQALRESIEVEALRYESLDSLQQEVLKLREGTRDFQSRIPTEHRLGDFLRDLGGVLQHSGMENHILQPRPVHSMSPGQLPAGSVADFAAMQVQPVLVQCEGRFSGVFDTLHGLEELNRMSRVERLSVTADPAKPGRVKMELLIDTFFLPPAATPPRPTPTMGGPRTP